MRERKEGRREGKREKGARTGGREGGRYMQDYPHSMGDIEAPPPPALTKMSTYCLSVFKQGHIVATECTHKQDGPDIIKTLDPFPSL